MQPSVNPSIRARQARYAAGDPKSAWLDAGGSVEARQASDAVIRRLGDEYPMLLAPIASPAADAETGETLRLIDFTALRVAGSYFIDVPGVGRSEAFEIVVEQADPSAPQTGHLP